MRSTTLVLMALLMGCPTDDPESLTVELVAVVGEDMEGAEVELQTWPESPECVAVGGNAGLMVSPEEGVPSAVLLEVCEVWLPLDAAVFTVAVDGLTLDRWALDLPGLLDALESGVLEGVSVDIVLAE